MKDFYNATPQIIKRSFNEKSYLSAKENLDSANFVQKKNKLCIWCQRHNRTSIQENHWKERCWYGDKPGWEKLATNNKLVEKSYFVAYHDSGSYSQKLL